MGPRKGFLFQADKHKQRFGRLAPLLPVLSINVARYRSKVGTSAAKGRLQPICLFLDIRLQSLTQEQSKLHPDTAKVGRCEGPTLVIHHCCTSSSDRS
jgi:hypothetical protein